MSAQPSAFRALLERAHAEILQDWLKEQSSSLPGRRDLMSDAELREQSVQLLSALRLAAASDEGDIYAQTWQGVRDQLAVISRARARLGFTPSETATFVFSLKQPIATALRQNLTEPNALIQELWSINGLIDRLGLYTTEVFQSAREDVIARQQAELLELSTPVVTLWQGVLALPLIGTLDSRRTQTVMEALLERIVETGSEIAIIDITGVPTVDTLTAQHLIKTITATRLMGAECIISGIRPQIAQTIVHLGVDLGDVLTKSSLSGALELALRRLGLSVTKLKPAKPAAG